MSQIIEVTDSTFERLVVQRVDKPVLVEFYATWCGPCRFVASMVERLSQELDERLSVFRMDADRNILTAVRYNIRSLPTMILFDGGKPENTLVGAVPYPALYSSVEPFAFREELKPRSEEEYVGLTIVEDQIRIVSLLMDGTYRFIDGASQYHNIIYAYSLEAAALKAAVEEFEHLVNDPRTKEQDVHEFFERHPDFILNDDYKQAHSKVVLERVDGGPLIPDFFLEPFGKNALCDLLELKTPSASAYVLKKNRMRFSAAVFEAAAQLREYSRYFDEGSHRQRLQERYGLEAYKPRMFIILGRTGKVNPLDLRSAELDLPGVTLRSFDAIL
ncbi:MAG TPA: Shedu anti-phage system protein SduA domain-containing protein, partial [Longimicrobiaceae bacterium]|nr:Shedu anti-phage system protein SduA domain-containing protein [Longimicrobiaceae bacterium]